MTAMTFLNVNAGGAGRSARPQSGIFPESTFKSAISYLLPKRIHIQQLPSPKKYLLENSSKTAFRTEILI
jgi:hypothetical protein